MKLFFSPGACSISPHIVLREAEIPFELERVDLRAKRTRSGADYRAINPKGYIPALELDDGQILTEGAVIVQFLADKKPEARLAPPIGTMERVRLQELLHFIATELHKGMSPLYAAKALEEYKEEVRQKLVGRFGILTRQIDDKPFAFGDTFTIADPYAYYVLRAWQKFAKQSLDEWPVLKAYYERIEARPAVRAALEAEGLKG
jgi:glutathione S-transferase